MVNSFILRYKNDTGEKKRVVSNFFSLSTLEIVNYIIPLITLPYLVRILGPAKYGIVAFAQVFASYFVIAVDFGYYLSAPRKISICRDNIRMVSKIFSRIMAIKFIFMLISVVIFLLLIFHIDRFTDERLVFLFSFGNVLGDFLFPTWFFQGMERMKLITIFYFIAKGFFLLLVFLFVKTPDGYFLVPLFSNLGLVVAGLISLYFIRRTFKIRISLPNLLEIKNEIKEEFSYFIATVSINAYTNSGTFILGLIAGNAFVGYYSAAERLVRAVQRILWAASQSIYPYINRLVSQSKESGLRFIRKLMLVFNGGFFVVSFLIFVFSNVLTKVIFGPHYDETYYVLRILSFLPFIISFSNIFGIQTMISLGMIKKYSLMLVIATLINILLSMILAKFYQHIGVAFAILFTELFIAVAAYNHLRMKHIKLLG